MRYSIGLFLLGLVASGCHKNADSKDPLSNSAPIIPQIVVAFKTDTAYFMVNAEYTTDFGSNFSLISIDTVGGRKFEADFYAYGQFYADNYHNIAATISVTWYTKKDTIKAKNCNGTIEFGGRPLGGSTSGFFTANIVDSSGQYAKMQGIFYNLSKY